MRERVGHARSPQVRHRRCALRAIELPKPQFNARRLLLSGAKKKQDVSTTPCQTNQQKGIEDLRLLRLRLLCLRLRLF